MPFSATKRHFNSGLCMSCIHLGRDGNQTNRASGGSGRGPLPARRVNPGSRGGRALLKHRFLSFSIARCRL